MVNFFATWCPACKVKIPNLVDLQNDYQNDIKVIGILLEDFKSNEEISKILSEFNINYTITNSSEGFDLAKALGGLKAIPTIFLVDKDGTIFQKYVGIVPNEMLEIDIKKLLEK
ncbi:TlpA family protein disulfide reductase [Aliarcobacter lanthieri]|uniref:TlpA family protein disulfide reductase n=1 Tax=Aliarcobacter lanthieri TaxID=1355374 RepID=UPI003AACA051